MDIKLGFLKQVANKLIKNNYFIKFIIFTFLINKNLKIYYNINCTIFENLYIQFLSLFSAFSEDILKSIGIKLIKKG